MEEALNAITDTTNFRVAPLNPVRLLRIRYAMFEKVAPPSPIPFPERASGRLRVSWVIRNQPTAMTLSTGNRYK